MTLQVIIGRASVFVLLGAMGLCPTAQAATMPVRLGDPVDVIRAKLGAPTRTIEACDGQVLFYGTTLLFVTNGFVGFVSVAEPSGVRVTTSLVTPDANLRPLSVQSSPPPQVSRPPLDSQQQRLAHRARQFAVTKAYASMSRDFSRLLPLAQAGSVVGMKDARGHTLPAFGSHAGASWYTLGVEIGQLVLSD